jgi:hypothetical protein
MKVVAFLSVLCSAGGVLLAQDREAAALRQLSGKSIGTSAGQVCFMDANADGVRDGVVGTTVTLAQVRAHTNTPAFLAYWPTSPEYAAVTAATAAATEAAAVAKAKSDAKAALEAGDDKAAIAALARMLGVVKGK